MDRPYITDADAIVTAAYLGECEVVAHLLGQGAPLETRDERGCTALMAAVEEGYLSVAEQLVKHGADVNATDQLGDTPLAVARYQKHHGLADFLEAHGASAPPGPSARERRDDEIYSAFESANAVRRLIDKIRKKPQE